MADGSAWWRTGAGIATWLILAVATTAVAWAAVGVVADQGNDPAAVPVPEALRTPDATASTNQPNQAAAPSASATSPADTAATSSSPEPGVATGQTSRVLASRGGSVSVKCVGSSGVRLVYATPADGWQLSVEKADRDDVEVEFLRGDEELRTRARCVSGAVEADVDSD